ncbi:hypothetical protein Tco_1188794, partial [Tanacetum coccineum]
LYTIEFKKRGLSHCYSLIWFSEATKIQRDDEVDRFISAKFPDQVEDPKGHKVVFEFMMQGPCGLANQSALCMQDSSLCSKHFPKKYSDESYIDKDDHVHYQIRETNVYTEKLNFRLDNSYVVL